MYLTEDIHMLSILTTKDLLYHLEVFGMTGKGKTRRSILPPILQEAIQSVPTGPDLRPPNQRVRDSFRYHDDQAFAEVVRQAVKDGADPLVVAFFDRASPDRNRNVKQLLAEGADPEVLIGDDSRSTLLAFAAGDGDLEMVDILVKAGADMDREIPGAGFGALGRAIYSDNFVVAIYLIQKGCDVNKWPHMEMIIPSGENTKHKVAAVRALINAGAHCNEDMLHRLESEGRGKYAILNKFGRRNDSSPNLLDLIRQWRIERCKRELTGIAEKARGVDLRDTSHTRPAM